MPDQLPIPVRDALREPFTPGEVEAMIARARKPAEKRGRGAKPFAFAAVAAAAVVAIVFAARELGTEEPGPIRTIDGPLARAITAPEGGARVDLDDGSEIALSDRARFEVLQNDGRELVLHARRGRFDVHVQAGGPRRWTIECGLATVVVVGTRFSIERSPDRVFVSVAEGVVLVRGELVPDRVQRLERGQSIEVLAPRRPAPAPAAVIAPEAPPVVEPAVEPAARATRPRWRDLADRGLYDSAYEALGPSGVRSEARRASAEELFALADVARLSGHPAEAVGPLEQLVREHPRDPSSALAAFTLGRIESDALHRADRAARAFEQAIELGLPDTLRADALARLALSLETAGDREGARRAASRYLAEHPEGPRAQAMTRIGAPD
jgi:transmembrane sensor